MNILQLEDTIKGLPDEALMQEAQQPSGQVPQFLVISEVQRRSDMRKRHQQQQQEQPQGTVADQVLQEGIAGMAPPSPGMQQAMGGPPTQMMYGGGVVRMQDMGQVPFYPDLASRGFGPSVGDMQQKINMLLESGVSTEDIISIIGEDDYKRAGFRMPTTQAAGLDLSGMNVPVGEDLVADLDQLSRTSRLMDDIATEPDVIPSAGFVGSAAQISEQPGNRYSSEFTDVLDEIRMGRTPSEKELSYPSLEIDPRLNLAQQEVLGIPRGSVTVEELGVRGPSNLEDLLAMATGSAGERVQQKIDATNASNAIKEDARKAKLDKRANRVSDSEYTAVANTNADMYATITNPRAGRETSTQEVIGKGHQDRLIKNQGAMDIVRELSSVAEDEEDVKDFRGFFRSPGERSGKPYSPTIIGEEALDKLSQFRGFNRAMASPIDDEKAVPGAEQFQELDEYLAGLGGGKNLQQLDEYLGGLGGGEPQLRAAKPVGGSGGEKTQLGGSSFPDYETLVGDKKSDPIGVAGEMGAALATLRDRPPLESTGFDISGIDTDYSAFDQAETYNRLIEEQKALADRARQEAKRDAGSMALVQLGAGIAAGDLSRGLSEAGSTAYDVRTSGRKEAREAEAAARALALSRAEGTQELQLLSRQAENQAEMAKREFEAKDKAAIAKINYSTTMDIYNAEMDGIMNRIQIERFGDLKRQVDEAAYRQIMSTAMEMTKLALQDSMGDLTEDKINSVFDNNVAIATERYKDLQTGGTTATGTGTAGAGAGAGASDRFHISPRPQDGSS